MQFNQPITEQMQLDWFLKLQNDATKEYFLFGEDVPIGLTHLYNISTMKKEASVGLFIGNNHFAGTGVGFFASKFILNRAFEELGIETLYAKVKQDNLESIRYNSFLGFNLCQVDKSGFDIYYLDKNTYQQKIPILNKYF